MDRLMISPIFPYLLAGAVLLGGLVLIWRGRRTAGAAARWSLSILGGLLAILGVAMSTGAIAMTRSTQQIADARPAGGAFVEVGGERLFFLCDGPRAGPTLLLLAGGYSSGWFLAPLHAELSKTHRSCLVDRPGTGWAGDFGTPRTIDRVLGELMDGVTKAGETGPIVPIGHSFGGLYAANLAQAYPKRVAAAVLLDPTPPTWFVEQQALYGCGPTSPGGFAFWASMFGLGLIPSLNPMNADSPGSPKRALGGLYPTLVDMESRPRSLEAARQALTDGCRNGLSLVRTTGALGDTPVLMMVQDQSQAELDAQLPPGLNARQQDNWRRLRALWASDYVGFTSRGQLVRAPAGAGHYFLLTRKKETLAAIEGFLAAQAPAAGSSRGPNP